MRLLLILLLALTTETNGFGVQIFVTPTIGPDFGFSGYTSPNFDSWASNVINGMILGTSPGTGVTQYIPMASGVTLSGAEFIATPFPSWKGIAPGPYDTEHGTALYFSFKAVAESSETFKVTDLAAYEVYLGQPLFPWSAGDFSEFSSFLVGRRQSDGSLTNSGDDGGILLTELYYVGLGFAQPIIGGAGTDQDQIDATADAIRSLPDSTTKVCYTIGSTSACGTVIIGESAVPEPSTIILFSAGGLGVWLLRKYSTLRAKVRS